MSVLANLIMNDMVKVKGQISEMALCIVDTEEKLAGKGMQHNVDSKNMSVDAVLKQLGQPVSCEILGSHHDKYEDYSFLGCIAV
jgi:GTP-sensing pleiotropic transcriptional regulator CodY